MYIYTNSPSAPFYVTLGKLYKAHISESNKSYNITDDDGESVLFLVGDSRWQTLSDYHAKHLEG